MRKDKLSSFQAKKQKLLKIKSIITKNQMNWNLLKLAKTKEEIKAVSEKIKMPNDLIKEIWEIVKDEN